MSLGKDDIEWAINIKLEQIPIELPPLDGMLEFIDYEGVVSKCLGLTNNGKPRKFRGIRTIKEIGSALTTGSNSLPDTSDRNDAVREHYDYILALVKNRNLKHSEQLINRNPRGRKLTLQVYERYLNVKGFPLRTPTADDFSVILKGVNLVEQDKSLIRPLIQIYIQHYTKLSADTVKRLASLIQFTLSQFKDVAKCPTSIKPWVSAASILFAVNADSNLAKNYLLIKKSQNQYNLHLYGSELEISKHTTLFTAVELQVLCCQIEEIPMGEDYELFDQIAYEKNETINHNWTVGAKAVEILINRCQKENQSTIPDIWADRLVEIACHPDPALSSEAEQQKYWHWATPEQLDMARMAFVRRDLEVVFEFLRNQAVTQKDGHMVNDRIDFYRKLMNNNLIKDTRLFLGAKLNRHLRSKFKDSQFWDVHDHRDKELCIIAFKMNDDFSFTTGTKSHPMRFYPNQSAYFDKIWNTFSVQTRQHALSQKLFEPDEQERDQWGQIIQNCKRKPHQGDWQWDVVKNILKSQFLGRVNWDHLNIHES